jgi:hypothetical protein
MEEGQLAGLVGILQDTCRNDPLQQLKETLQRDMHEIHGYKKCRISKQ